MNLQTAIMQAPSFSVLKQISDDARADVSFSGIRYLEAPGYGGRASIDLLAWRVTDIAVNVVNYNQEERKVGKSIPKILFKLYKESNKQLTRKKIITKICCFFRDLLQHAKELRGYNNPRYDWSVYLPQTGCYVFKYYSKIQYETCFGPTPEDAPNGHPPFNKKGSAIRWEHP